MPSRSHFLVICLLVALRRAPSGVATFKGLFKVLVEFYLMTAAGGAVEQYFLSL